MAPVGGAASSDSSSRLSTRQARTLLERASIGVLMVLVVLFGVACGSTLDDQGSPSEKNSAEGQMGSKLDDTVPEPTQLSESEARGDTPRDDTGESDAWWWRGLFGFE